jgi:hypothetical protein
MVPPFTGLWASVPATVNEEAVPDRYKDLWFSQEQNANSPVLGAIFANMDTFGSMPSTFVPEKQRLIEVAKETDLPCHL